MNPITLSLSAQYINQMLAAVGQIQRFQAALQTAIVANQEAAINVLNAMGPDCNPFVTAVVALETFLTTVEATYTPSGIQNLALNPAANLPG
jgi:hypothetical protein